MLQAESVLFILINDSIFIPQAQMRDLSGFVETRQQLLTLKPNHRMNWIGFAVAHHLSSKYANLFSVRYCH